MDTALCIMAKDLQYASDVCGDGAHVPLPRLNAPPWMYTATGTFTSPTSFCLKTLTVMQSSLLSPAFPLSNCFPGHLRSLAWESIWYNENLQSVHRTIFLGSESEIRIRKRKCTSKASVSCGGLGVRQSHKRIYWSREFIIQDRANHETLG